MEDNNAQQPESATLVTLPESEKQPDKSKIQFQTVIAAAVGAIGIGAAGFIQYKTGFKGIFHDKMPKWFNDIIVPGIFGAVGFGMLGNLEAKHSEAMRIEQKESSFLRQELKDRETRLAQIEQAITR